jgi:DNA-binding response OmpR family regulator
MLAYWLDLGGIPTGVALTGYDARAMLTRGATRLLVTDRVLPPWPGLDTLVSLKQTFSGLKVAFIDDGLPDTRTLVRSAGADIILPRPLRRATVLDAFGGMDAGQGGVACAS